MKHRVTAGYAGVPAKAATSGSRFTAESASANARLADTAAAVFRKGARTYQAQVVKDPLRLTVLSTGYLGTAGLTRRAAGWDYRAPGVALTPPLSTQPAERRGTERRGHSGSR
jgi:hypothetical protein